MSERRSTPSVDELAGALPPDDPALGAVVDCHVGDDPRAVPLPRGEGVDLSAADVIEAVAADLEGLGIPVLFVDGWHSRGRPFTFEPQGMVIHHTADRAYDSDYGALGIVRDGRSDLPGPLAQFGLGRSNVNGFARVYVIAAGYANHAGPGGWGNLSGNGSVWGVEAANDGVGEEWGEHQLKSYVALAHAVAGHTAFGADRICCHREWNPVDKIDPTNIDGDWFRTQVETYQEDALTQEEHDALIFTAQFLQDFKTKVVEPLGDGDWGRGFERMKTALKMASERPQ